MDNLAGTELHRTECLALLATSDFGHLALTRRALPTIVPAHYLLRPDRIVIHASTGHDLTPWKGGEIVTLHVDAFDPDRRAGWSVSVTGAAHETHDLDRMERLPHAPWLTHGDGNMIAIATDLICGYRLRPAMNSSRDQ